MSKPDPNPEPDNQIDSKANPAPAPKAKPTPDPKPDPKPDPAPEAKTFTQADIDAAVKKAQKEAEKKAADAEAKAKLSEDERAKAEIAELQNQLRDRDARDAISTEAEKRGFKKNSNVFYKLFQSDIEFDDKGKVSNLADLFDSAKAEYPELFIAKPVEGIDGGKQGGGVPSEEDAINEAYKATGRTNSYRL